MERGVVTAGVALRVAGLGNLPVDPGDPGDPGDPVERVQPASNADVTSRATTVARHSRAAMLPPAEFEKLIAADQPAAA